MFGARICIEDGLGCSGHESFRVTFGRFFDADDDGLYDPLKGDYPSIEIRGCPNDRYPDEMIFWIYNDEGGALQGNSPFQVVWLPDQVREWIEVQERKSIIPDVDQLLVETFPRGDRHYLVCYPFEGRLAHQTLGMLLTRRMERAGLKPLGFVASEYALSVWALEDMRGEDLDQLFHQDMLGDDLDAWLEESALMKRTFRNNALISGLIERRMPKHEKTGRQITFSTDLIYDVLRSHEPDHILLQAARQDAGEGLLDIRRLADALKRIKGKIVHSKLDQISPFAVPVMLEIGKEPVFSGDAAEAILREAEDDLVRDAMS